MTGEEALTAETVRQLGRARRMDWSLEEAGAIRDQLESIREALAAAQERLAAAGAGEPAVEFEAAP